jgi:mRNA-degrading endonuclease YafQ of YafQ-DinJ toxin-antitoxin module
MAAYEVLYSRGFKKDLAKMPAHIQKLVEEKEIIFSEDPFHPGLKAHKLHGKDADKWTFSVNYSYRVKFAFLSEGEVIFIAIGTHSIYE